MKAVLILCTVFASIHLIHSQTNPDLEWDVVFQCINQGINEIPTEDRPDMAEWAAGARETTTRLMEQRRRCYEILGDPPTALQERLHQACMATWTASVLWEANSLRNDLSAISDSETADEFRSNFLECFGVVDEEIETL